MYSETKSGRQEFSRRWASRRLVSANSAAVCNYCRSYGVETPELCKARARACGRSRNNGSSGSGKKPEAGDTHVCAAYIIKIIITITTNKRRVLECTRPAGSSQLLPVRKLFIIASSLFSPPYQPSFSTLGRVWGQKVNAGDFTYFLYAYVRTVKSSPDVHLSSRNLICDARAPAPSKISQHAYAEKSKRAVRRL